MKVFVLNCGSSSVKFRLYEMDSESCLTSGIVDAIGSRNASISYQYAEGEAERIDVQIQNHQDAVESVLHVLSDSSKGYVVDIEEIDAVGHRVVHGGELFTGSVLIDEAVLNKIEECIRFAPLHNPPNIEGIKASLWHLPFARQVAVFDTAFHQTLLPDAYIYALPYAWYEVKGIRRYGFHGTSHQYVAGRVSEILKTPLEDLRIITCHLGNGSSVAAVKQGRSIDTTMGFTPMEGVPMGTRCGTIDPAIPLHVMEADHMTIQEMDSILNKRSGLAGITGGDSDLRVIEQMADDGSERHRLALSVFTRAVKKTIGAYAAIMGGVDALVFTAGIGEHSSMVRRMCCEGLEFLGIEIDEHRNRDHRQEISRGRVHVLVVGTNEEWAIARQTVQLLESRVQTVLEEECM